MSHPQQLRLSLLYMSLAAFACATPLPEQSPIQTQPIQLGSGEWRVTDNTIVITDASGTMYVNQTFPTAKALARSFVAAMPDANAPAPSDASYDVGSIGFGGDARNTAALAPFDRDRLARQTASIEIMGDVSGTGGTTPLADVITEAAKSLDGRTGRAAVVIFSDGLPDDPGAARLAAGKLVAGYPDGVCIHAVQTGTDPAGTAFLKSITDLTRCGSLRNAQDLKSGFEVQQLAKAVFVGEAQLPQVAAPNPCHDVMRLRGVNFGFDRADISEDSKPLLDVAVERLRECPEIEITIGGYTDSIGTEQYNAGLSYRRAVAARNYLVSKGIAAGRIGTEGFGESDPIATNDTIEGRALNRRVELTPVQ